MECDVLAIFLLLIGVSSAKQNYAHCSRLNCIRNPSCLTCEYPSCSLDTTVSVNCTTVPECVNQESVKLNAYCNYCWQIDDSLQDCQPMRNCSTTSTKTVITQCKVHADVICKGSRQFSKRVQCNWSSGTSWIKTMTLSVTVGGLGIDRFYLGLWKSGIGKLFSFGGLGVWTVVDIILIAAGYIRPADGSMYM